VDWSKFRWLAGRFARPETPKVHLVVVCAVTMAGVSCVQAVKVCSSCLLSSHNRCSNFSPINCSSGVTVTDSRNLVGESPSSQNSSSFNDAVRDTSAPDIDDRF